MAALTVCASSMPMNSCTCNPVVTAAELGFCVCVVWSSELQFWLRCRCLWEHTHLDSKMAGSRHAVHFCQTFSSPLGSMQKYSFANQMAAKQSCPKSP